jgi:hypothetical protein
MPSCNAAERLRAAHPKAADALDCPIRHLGGTPTSDAWLTERLLDVFALDCAIGGALSRRYEVSLLDLDQAMRQPVGRTLDEACSAALAAEVRRLAGDVAGLVRTKDAQGP